MVTDTALNRNRCYHRACDTPDRLDYGRMAEVVVGLEAVIADLATATRLDESEPAARLRTAS